LRYLHSEFDSSLVIQLKNLTSSALRLASQAKNFVSTKFYRIQKVLYLMYFPPLPQSRQELTIPLHPLTSQGGKLVPFLNVSTFNPVYKKSNARITGRVFKVGRENLPIVDILVTTSPSFSL